VRPPAALELLRALLRRDPAVREPPLRPRAAPLPRDPAPLRDALRLVRTPRARASAVSRATSLLKLLISPPRVVSCSTSASPDSSNLSNHSSQEISSSDSSPEYPGRSMRMIPISSPSPAVRFTCAGFPPRSSAQLRISSWSVVVLFAIRHLSGRVRS
jgi:hypothetical protein